LENVRVADNFNDFREPASGVSNSGHLTIRSSVISRNTADGAAAIENYTGGILAIYDTSITGNVADPSHDVLGGAGITNRGTLHIERSDISSNRNDPGEPGNETGGIYSQTTATVIDSTISNNTGGGVRGSFDLYDTTVTGNTGGAGGIAVEGVVNLHNTTVTGNSPNDCTEFVTEADAASSDSDGTCIPGDAPTTHFIYDDSTHWANWSWSTAVDQGDTDPVHGGDRSLRVAYNSPWAGLSFHHDGFDTSDFSTLRFAIHTGGNPFPNIRLKVYGATGSELGKIDPRNYDSDAGGGWLLVSVPLADLGATDTMITRVTLQDASGSPPPAFNMDSYGFWSD
jgi:hypothetical protein